MKKIKLTRFWEHPTIDENFGFTADVADSLPDEEFEYIHSALVDATDDYIGLSFNGFDDSHYFNVYVVGYCVTIKEIDAAADVLRSFGYELDFPYEYHDPDPDLEYDSYWED